MPEFLASKRPILAFPEDPGAMSDRVIRDYRASEIANSKDDIKRVLLNWYRIFKSEGSLDLPVNEQVIDSFGSMHKASELGAILRTVTNRATATPLAKVSVE